jgi:hypothetical protein
MFQITFLEKKNCPSVTLRTTNPLVQYRSRASWVRGGPVTARALTRLGTKRNLSYWEKCKFSDTTVECSRTDSPEKERPDGVKHQKGPCERLLAKRQWNRSTKGISWHYFGRDIPLAGQVYAKIFRVSQHDVVYIHWVSNIGQSNNSNVCVVSAYFVWWKFRDPNSYLEVRSPHLST